MTVAHPHYLDLTAITRLGLDYRHLTWNELAIYVE